MVVRVSLNHGGHLGGQLLQKLVLLLLDVFLGVFKISLQRLLLDLDVFIKLGLGGIAQGVLPLVELILQGINFVLLQFKLLALRVRLRFQICGGFLTVLGAHNSALEINYGDLGRRLAGRLTGGLGTHRRGESQGEAYRDNTFHSETPNL